MHTAKITVSRGSIGKMSTTDKTQGELELGYQHTLVSCLIFNDFVQVCLPLFVHFIVKVMNRPKEVVAFKVERVNSHRNSIEN